VRLPAHGTILVNRGAFNQYNFCTGFLVCNGKGSLREAA